MIGEKWLTSIEEKPIILQLVAAACNQQTDGIDLQQLNLQSKHTNFALLKQSAECYLKAFADQESIEHCKTVLTIIKKLGELSLPEANEVSLTILAEVYKWAHELGDDVYKKYITDLMDNIKADNTSKNDEIYDTFLGGVDNPLPTVPLYPNLSTEAERSLDVLNQNLCDLVPTSPIPAMRHNLPYSILSSATPTPDQEDKSLAASIAQDNLNANLSPTERRLFKKIVRQAGILEEELSENEQQYEKELVYTYINNACKELQISLDQLRAKLRIFSSNEKRKVDEHKMDELVAAFNQFTEGHPTQILGENLDV